MEASSIPEASARQTRRGGRWGQRRRLVKRVPRPVRERYGKQKVWFKLKYREVAELQGE